MTTQRRQKAEFILLHMVLKAICLAGMTATLAAADVTILRGARILDGMGAAAIDGADLVIEGESIVFVGPPDGFQTPFDAKIVDCHGKTLIPGLIAVHSHIGQVDGVENGAANFNRENILRQLRQYEAYGITTIVSLGLNGPLFYELRKDLHAGKLPGADLFGADRGIGVAGGAPPESAIKIEPDQLDRPETPDAARAAVRAAKERGADLVKIWVDDFRGALPAKMSPEIYAAVIDEAHKYDLQVAAHVYYLADAKSLVEAGVDVLAHGVRDQAIDGELIDQLKSEGVWYVATIGVDESAYIYADQPKWMQTPFFQNSLQPALRAQLDSAEWRQGILANRTLAASREAVVQNLENIAALHDAGVKIGFGADSGANPLRIPGFSEHRELQLHCEAGLSPIEALRLATANSVALLGLKDRGVLAKDKLADVIVLGSDSIEDVLSFQRIEAVWHRGKQVSGPITSFNP